MYTGLTFLDHLVCCFKNVYTSQQTFHDSTVHRRRRYRRTTTSKQASNTSHAWLQRYVDWCVKSRSRQRHVANCQP